MTTKQKQDKVTEARNYLILTDHEVLKHIEGYDIEDYEDILIKRSQARADIKEYSK